jgi:hypothetical protein
VSTELLQTGTPLIRIFEIYRPQIPLDFEVKFNEDFMANLANFQSICNFINAVFVLQVRTSPLSLQQSSQQSNQRATEQPGMPDEDFSVAVNSQHLKLKGSIWWHL